MNYIEFNFEISPLQPGTEILIAELGYAGFESFVETESGVIAYIQEEDYHETILDSIQILSSNEFNISYNQKLIEQTNWNSEWEKNFNPIVVDDIVSVRAPFHNCNETCEYDIVIEPKMSFGTGHHETTHMMLQHMLDIDFTNKVVLDMGCGTGILAIFASMKNAKQVDAIDIDNWCYLNSIENVDRNNCKNIVVFEGDVSLLGEKKYDVIIANINRNILLNDIHTYLSVLNDNGVLLLSGFYSEDIPIINQEVTKYIESEFQVKKLNNWVSLKYIK